MCILSLLSHEHLHGYEIVRRLNATGLDTVGYGTVYPLLTRMRRLGLITDGSEPSPNGPPRKVYAPTAQGRHELSRWNQQWSSFVALIDTLLVPSSTRR
jgi:PadR family transcriptional regulator